MDHHLICGQIELIALKTVQNFEMLCHGLPQPEIWRRATPSRRFSQSVMYQQASADKAVAGALCYENMKLIIDPTEPTGCYAIIACVQELIYLCAQ